jgi:hypothetical protein
MQQECLRLSIKPQKIKCKISSSRPLPSEAGEKAGGTNNRKSPIYLVVGSSGSGKTTSCLSDLGADDASFCRVYMHANQISKDSRRLLEKALKTGPFGDCRRMLADLLHDPLIGC